MHEETVLEAAARAVDVAVVVDRCALRVDALLERLDDGVAERLDLRALEAADGRSGWMRARKSASSA